MKYNLKRETREISSWLSDERVCSMLVEHRAQFERYAQGEISLDLGHSISILSMLQVGAAKESLIRVADGDPQGWAGISSAAEYRYWDAMASIAVRRANGGGDARLPLNPLSAGILLLELMICDRAERVVGFANWLERELLEGRYFKNLSSDWAYLSCYAVALAKAPDDPHFTSLDPRLDCGPYRAVLDSWNDPERLAGAMLAACDYHELQMKGSNRIAGVFYSNPERNLPVELLALKAVREGMGMPTPWPSHPLLNTPFAQAPVPLPSAEHDERLDQYLARLETVLPGLRSPANLT